MCIPDEMPEQSKPGGLSYEFVLEEARTQRSEHPHLKCPATPTPSAQDIERKLKVFFSCPRISINILTFSNFTMVMLSRNVKIIPMVT